MFTFSPLKRYRNICMPHLYSTGSFTAKNINDMKDEDGVHISFERHSHLFERQNEYSNILEHTVN